MRARRGTSHRGAHLERCDLLVAREDEVAQRLERVRGHQSCVAPRRRQAHLPPHARDARSAHSERCGHKRINLRRSTSLSPPAVQQSPPQRPRRRGPTPRRATAAAAPHTPTVGWVMTVSTSCPMLMASSTSRLYSSLMKCRSDSARSATCASAAGVPTRPDGRRTHAASAHAWTGGLPAWDDSEHPTRGVWARARAAGAYVVPGGELVVHGAEGQVLEVHSGAHVLRHLRPAESGWSTDRHGARHDQHADLRGP